MKRILVVTLVGLSVVLLTTCKKDKEEQPGSIYGVITDKATGEPIRSAGVELQPNGTKTVTGSEGQFEFTEQKVGDYTLKVTKTGYAELLDYKVKVESGKTTKVDVQITKLPSALRVVDGNGKDINVLDFGGETSVITRSFSIFNDSPESLEWLITKNCEWITELSKTTGTLQAGKQTPVSLTIDRAKLSGGDNTYILSITSDNGSKELIVTANSPIVSLPTLNTLAVSNITASSAIFNGTITATGSPTYTERGFVYATSSMPTLATTISKKTEAVTATAAYSSTVLGLTMGQSYYVRAYAINSVGTAYSSNEVTFKPEMTLPNVTTQAVSSKSISTGTVSFNGTIVDVGDPAYTERGFVYGFVPNPTVDDDTKKTASGSGTGVFSSNMSGMTEGSIYHVRAYATNTKGTAYGLDVNCDFNAVMPVVTTNAVTDITGTSAQFNGNIGSIGDPAYTERGFVYGTMHNPTIENDTKKTVTGTSTGAFFTTITGLTTGTTYYVRAYATNSKGTIYGSEVNFIPASPEYIILSASGLMVQKTDLGTFDWNSAVNNCNGSILSGYTDWRLPTKDELAILYNERTTIGGFSAAYYWSSTLSYNYAYIQSFSTGELSSYDVNKSYNTCRCRCVRSLP
jgi:hypothetical protein